MDTNDIKTHMNEIRAKVDKNFKYELDIDQHGLIEHWYQPDSDYDGNKKITGDCEDFALHCRKLLRDLGLDTRLIYCTVRGEGHVVLECNGWIIDNIQSKARSNSYLETRKGYEFIMISGYNPGDPWHYLDGKG